MLRFVAVPNGNVAAPAHIRVVHDVASVKNCDELRYVLPVGGREGAALLGGDTVLYAKTKDGAEGAWAYRCGTVVGSVR